MIQTLMIPVFTPTLSTFLKTTSGNKKGTDFQVYLVTLI